MTGIGPPAAAADFCKCPLWMRPLAALVDCRGFRCGFCHKTITDKSPAGAAAAAGLVADGG